ncbi:hypothetical protein AAUPMB_17886 [Pasteurella multocida subsp. multocida str. Anand1_buffalo]|nr:hypothetical protein AAUPMB_17886 [Pasteurella multocida subsp. multocida str. Anand1_buffalo]
MIIALFFITSADSGIYVINSIAFARGRKQC